jgi:hypothetical protein
VKVIKPVVKTIICRALAPMPVVIFCISRASGLLPVVNSELKFLLTIDFQHLNFKNHTFHFLRKLKSVLAFRFFEEISAAKQYIQYTKNWWDGQGGSSLISD